MRCRRVASASNLQDLIPRLKPDTRGGLMKSRFLIQGKCPPSTRSFRGWWEGAWPACGAGRHPAGPRPEVKAAGEWRERKAARGAEEAVDFSSFLFPPPPLSVSLPVNSLCGCPAIESIAAAAPNEFRSSSLGNGAADPKLWALIHLSSV